jgi:2-amino-4-hydroxy-6-hydroxymethyldihydropteridine diphosphokinase
MNSAYLLIGGNLRNRTENLAKARSFVEDKLGKIIKASSIYETAAWGITEQPEFLNQVLLIQTKLAAEKMMEVILTIENKMGRIRSQKNASRIIDIDILFFNDEIINQSNLSIPHPQIQNRRFVLVPLNEIASGLIHPVIKQSIKNLLSTTNDKLEVKPLGKL